MKKTIEEQQQANAWIKELREAGYTHEEMVDELGIAFVEYEQSKVEDFEKRWNVSIVEKVLPDKTKKYRVHGHSSTESETRFEVIEKYLIHRS